MLVFIVRVATTVLIVHVNFLRTRLVVRFILRFPLKFGFVCWLPLRVVFLRGCRFAVILFPLRVDTGPVTFFLASVAYGVTSRAVVLSPGVVSAVELTFMLLALLNEVDVRFSATLGFRELFHMRHRGFMLPPFVQRLFQSQGFRLA